MSQILRHSALGGVLLAFVAGGDLQGAKLASTNPPRTSFQTPTAGPQAAQSRPEVQPASAYRAVLDRYCVTCHNARLRTANLMLDTVDIGEIGAGAEIWEKVVRKLRSRAMPPMGRPRPDQTTYQGFVGWLEAALDQAATARPNPGRPAIHRLNRAEYTNAIRDLVALEIDGRLLLPADDSEYGFDNIADVLTVSPGLMERYISAAAKISRLAIGDPHLRPAVETYKVSPLLVQDDRTSEEMPFGTRGGIAVRHSFPLDAEYVLRVRLQGRGSVRGLAEPQQIEVRLDGARITLFTVGGPAAKSAEPGDQQSNYKQPAAAGLEVRFAAKAGTRLVGVALLKRTVAPEGVGPRLLPVGSISFAGKKGAETGVDSVEIAGPFNAQGRGETPSRRQIFVCRPASPQQEESCATEILATLARRA